MWGDCVIDASMGANGGLLCFCPVELGPDGEIESIITGMNFVGAPPTGSAVIGVVHEDGQDAAEAFYAEHRNLIEPFFVRAA